MHAYLALLDAKQTMEEHSLVKKNISFCYDTPNVYPKNQQNFNEKVNEKNDL